MLTFPYTPMNTQKVALALIALLLVVGGGVLLFTNRRDSSPIPPPSPTSTPIVPTSTPPVPPTPTSTDALIRVTTPTPNLLVRSPLAVRGEARGSWYFEGSFPVRLLDANGTELAVTPAQAYRDWMTADLAPFSAELSFGTPTTETGTLVLEKDNPSGLPEHAAEYRIPVRFASSTAPAEQRVVQLYYYNPAQDTDKSGSILCSRDGLEAVSRTIPLTQTPLQDTLRLLLKGELTAAERAKGITTEFPLPGLELQKAVVTESAATLTFADPRNKTTGGSCRVSVLWAQIEATVKQFTGDTPVRFSPDSLFQP